MSITTADRLRYIARTESGSAGWPCRECGGSREHSYGCPALDRIAAPLIEGADALDIECGDKPSNGSLVKRERMGAEGMADEWVRVCVCISKHEAVDGVCPNCRRERA